nr:LytTR family DNA-binding domain-containing protein [Roseivirga sp. E12]
MIIVIETLVFIVRDFQKSGTSNEQSDQNQYWTFKSGNKTFNISPHQIAYLFSQKGMVYAVKNDGEKILTQFSSLNELSEAYNIEGFFRLNRQFVISTSAVKQVQKDINQKLRVSLEPATTNIPSEAIVSRYTGPEFKRWINQ